MRTTIRIARLWPAFFFLACATGGGPEGQRCFVTPEHQARLSALLDDARLMPVFAEGQIYGQRFTRIEPGSHFDRLGFAVEDVIVAVNGERVASTASSTYLLCVLGGTAPARIEVERGGSPKTLTFEPPG